MKELSRFCFKEVMLSFLSFLISRYVVAWWDTSFGTATKPKGTILVHLEGNDGRTRVKRNHQSCLRHVGLPYFVVKG
jgi:hypothetical protein